MSLSCPLYNSHDRVQYKFERFTNYWRFDKQQVAERASKAAILRNLSWPCCL